MTNYRIDARGTSSTVLMGAIGPRELTRQLRETAQEAVAGMAQIIQRGSSVRCRHCGRFLLASFRRHGVTWCGMVCLAKFINAHNLRQRELFK